MIKNLNKNILKKKFKNLTSLTRNSKNIYIYSEINPRLNRGHYLIFNKVCLKIYNNYSTDLTLDNLSVKKETLKFKRTYFKKL